MKKLVYIMSVFLTGMFLTVNRAHAMFGDFTPLIPIAPQLSPVGMPSSIVVAVKYVKQAKQIRDTLAQYQDVSKIKQLFSKYFAKLGAGAFSSLRQSAAARKKVVSYSRTIEESTVADIHDEASVKDAFENMFLEYPSAKDDVKVLYKDKGEQFKIDTTLELFISAKEMAKELYGEENATDIDKIGMIELVNRFENCLMSDEGCDELEIETCDTGEKNSAEGQQTSDDTGEEGEEDNVCFWNNALKVVRIYNKLLRYNEYLVAMQAQYRAAMSIDGAAKIKEFKPEEEKESKEESSAADYLVPAVNYAYSEMSADSVFADMTSGKSLPAIFEGMTKVGGFPDVLDDKADDLAGFEEIAKVNRDLTEAKSAHNMKQILIEYRKAFETQKSMHEYHQKTIDYVNIARGCANRSIGGAGDTFTNYIKALSEQAKIENAVADGESYIKVSDESATKSAEEDSGSYVTINNEKYILRPIKKGEGEGVYVTPQDEEADDTLPSLNATKKKGNSAADSDSEQYSTDQRRDEEVKAESRVDDLLNWTLGSEFVKMNSQASVLWHDQKEFYDQYLDGKYDNIEAYVKDVPMTDVLAALSQSINTIFPYYAEEIKQVEDYLANLEYKYSITTDEDELNSLSKSIADTKADLEAWYKKREDFRKKMKTAIDNLGKALASFKVPEDEIETLLADEEKLFTGLAKVHQDKMDKMEKDKEKLFDELDKLGKKLDTVNKEYNEQMDIVKNSDKSMPKSSGALEYGKLLYKFFMRVVNLDFSPQSLSFTKSKSKAEEDKRMALSRLAGMENPKTIELKIKEKQKELSQLKEDMEEERKQFVKRNADAEADARINSENIVLNFESSIPNDIIDSAMSSIIPVGYAGRLMSCIQDYAAKQVAETRQEIDEYRDQNNPKMYELIYYADKADTTVHAIHKKLIDKLTNIHASTLAGNGCEVIAELEAVTGSSAEIFVAPLASVFTNICSGVSCLSPDGDYFVGLVPQKRDFSMPKAAVNFASAPLREVFHFDIVDYHNVDKYYNKKKLDSNDDVIISRYSFLNSGLDIPELWRYILKRHAFVQKEIDLAKLMGEEGNPAFLGSGVYPCQLRYGEQGYQIAPARKPGTGSFKYVVHTGPLPSHPCHDPVWCGMPSGCCSELNQSYSESLKCRNIELEFTDVAKKSKYGPHYPAKLTDLEVGGGLGMIVWPNGFPSPEPGYVEGDSRFSKGYNKYSELGTILAYIPNRGDLIKNVMKYGEKNLNMNLVRHDLTFNDDLQRVVFIQENTKEVGKNKKDDALLYLARRALLDKDVFGNYLDFMEIESVAADSEKKADLQVETVREDLRKIFLGTGFDISDEFNLLNEEDFNAAGKVLDDMKAKSLDKVKSGLAGIKGKTDNIKSKIEQINHAIKVMEMDSDELVHIGGDEDFAELAEKIKNQSANKKVEAEYGKEGDAEFDRQRENLRPPYCPIYSVN